MLGWRDCLFLLLGALAGVVACIFAGGTVVAVFYMVHLQRDKSCDAIVYFDILLSKSSSHETSFSTALLEASRDEFHLRYTGKNLNGHRAELNNRCKIWQRSWTATPGG